MGEFGRFTFPRLPLVRYAYYGWRRVEMATSEGLFEFTKLRQQHAEAATPRTGWGKKKDTQPQPALRTKCNIPTREFRDSMRQQVSQSCHLWFLADNADQSTMGDLRLFGNSDDV